MKENNVSLVTSIKGILDGRNERFFNTGIKGSLLERL